MGLYIQEWDCCDLETRTEGYELDSCPLCKVAELKQRVKELETICERAIWILNNKEPVEGYRLLRDHFKGIFN